MAGQTTMFLFEVTLQKVECYVDISDLVFKADFSEIFSLELKDPKKMNIKIPDPPPPPPEPPGKKGKKKKPKPKKPKKGKKGKEPPPPPEPVILVGQSVLFVCTPEYLREQIEINPLEVSAWNKDDKNECIGSIRITWDPIFPTYIEHIYTCKDCPPPMVNDEYNIFDEGRAKIIAKVRLQIKLLHLTDKIVASFRSLSEDPSVRKWLYTGMNSKVTSFISNLKTTDDEFQMKWEKYKERQRYHKDRVFPTPDVDKKPQVFASYKNAPGANLPLLDERDLDCCKGFADKPPTDKYDTMETCPDIDFICDYVRKIIASCNDNMRMLTPRPTIKPRVRATDMDKLCYCKETSWPTGELAERFKNEVQSTPCPICIRKLGGKDRPGTEAARTFNIANIRGPCGRHDCKIAREMREYLQKLLDEDNKVINLEDIVGPCGSKTCTLADKIIDFLRHKGAFSHETAATANKPGLSTQCACTDLLQKSFELKGSCHSLCSFDCETNSEEYCGGRICPYSTVKESCRSLSTPDLQQSTENIATPSKENVGERKKSKNVSYQVYYFTVDYNNDVSPNKSSTTPTTATSTSRSPIKCKCTSPSVATPSVTTQSAPLSLSLPQSPASEELPEERETFKYCKPDCPIRDEEAVCSKNVCPEPAWVTREKPVCTDEKCPNKEKDKPEQPQMSPLDSEIVINLDDITNPCCVKTCGVAEKVKEFIAEGWSRKQVTKVCAHDYPCYCDCVCDFKIPGKTTYCALCGGYECLGDDVKEMPPYAKPHPCPVYHKLYDRKLLQTISPWPEENKKNDDSTNATTVTKSAKSSPYKLSIKSAEAPKQKAGLSDLDCEEIIKAEKEKRAKKKDKYEDFLTGVKIPKKHKCRYAGIELVPRNMGWNWKAEDVPGLKYRPKWRPGAANRILVRRYWTTREGIDIIAKKKRMMLGKKKKLEMKPTLVVTKKDGEYTVQMEVFKKYSKERLLHQYPYEEKPPLVYVIGKTEEVKAKIQRQRERRERRETRRKNRLLQSTFRDKCQEICLKAYNQSIGLLPLPDANFPDCPCDVPAVKPMCDPIVDSCSCSESGTISSSDTDNDEWIVEFTPPLATWDVKAKHPPVLIDDASQYTYLDYKVKLEPKFGYPVPQYFIGPTGKKECSDLGGFWGPGHVWLEINKDGYISCDNRWVPSSFIGPDGDMYNSDEGFFVDTTGASYKIGVDGYVDENNHWQFYGRMPRKVVSKLPPPVMPTVTKPASAASTPQNQKPAYQPPKTLKPPSATRTEAKLTDEKPVKKLKFQGKGQSVMNVSVNNSWLARKKYSSRMRSRGPLRTSHDLMSPGAPLISTDVMKDADTRQMKYNEIMMHPEPEPRLPTKMSRACSAHVLTVSTWAAAGRPRAHLANKPRYLK